MYIHAHAHIFISFAQRWRSYLSGDRLSLLRKCLHSDSQQGTLNSTYNLCHTTWLRGFITCNALQHTSAHCNTLQHTATSDVQLARSRPAKSCQLTHKSGKQIARAKVTYKSDTQKWHTNCIYMYIYLYIYIYIYICIYYIQIHIINTYTHMLTQGSVLEIIKDLNIVHIHIYLHILHIHIHIYIHIYNIPAHTHTYTHTCRWVY